MRAPPAGSGRTAHGRAILIEHGIDDPGLAARLARICGGRPGHALAWAADPDALRQRDELTRVLLDLTAARPSERLAAVRSATVAAIAISGVVERSSSDAGTVPAESDPGSEAAAPRTPAAERRRAADVVVAIWADVARDLLLSRIGSAASLTDPRLLEEMAAIAVDIDEAALIAFLDRLGRAGVLLGSNVSPELVLDDLALAWPSRRSHAA